MVRKIFPVILVCIVITACNHPADYTQINEHPSIIPDYTDVTIPYNIAPLNFYATSGANNYFLLLEGENSHIRFHSKNGEFKIPVKKWKKLIRDNTGMELSFTLFSKEEDQWKRYQSFNVAISKDSITPYIAYRIIDPGNLLWGEMGIYQRCLENFDESAIMKNSASKTDCMNCHSFSNYNPDKLSLHLRGEHGGTLIYNEGTVSFLNTKTPYTLSNATYPSWHPTGKYIAYSVNTIHQSFFTQTDKYEVVQDRASDIVLYNVEKNELSAIPGLTTKRLENIPSWSPDGKYLYYISGSRFNADNYMDNKYDLLRIPFDPVTARWGTPDTLLKASETGKSLSFPAASPDGKHLLFIMADYGYFTVYNNEADVYVMDMETHQYRQLNSNSSYVESYPSWSENGKWIMFVSKQDNNMFSRPWFCHFNNDGSVDKPFVLPQEDPAFYDSYVKNFNRPEYIRGKVQLTPKNIKDIITQQEPVDIGYDESLTAEDAFTGATIIKN